MPQIEELVREHFDLRPAAILRDLDLRRPIYAKTAAYGHFGRDDGDFTWERTDKRGRAARGGRVSRRDATTAWGDEQARPRPSREIARSPPFDAHDELIGRRSARLDHELRSRHEPLVVEPVEKVAVVLGEAHDRRARRPAASVGERRELAFSACSTSGSTGQPCGQRSGWPSFSSIRSTISSVNVSPSSSARSCASAAGVAHEVGEEPLDDPVLADDALGALAAGRREERLLALAALDQPFGLEALQHLAGRRARDVEHLGDARGERGRAGAARRVLADRKGEEVDRLEVLVDRVARPSHRRLSCRSVAVVRVPLHDEHRCHGTHPPPRRDRRRHDLPRPADRAACSGSSRPRRACLSALATGILLFLLWDVLAARSSRSSTALDGSAHWGRFAWLAALGVAGFALGLMGLVYYDGVDEARRPARDDARRPGRGRDRRVRAPQLDRRR